MLIRFKNYQIESDPLNIILYRISIGKGDKNKGKETKFLIGYYDTLEHMLQSLAHRKIKMSEATTLKELQQDIADIMTFISESVSDIKIDIRKEVKINDETRTTKSTVQDVSVHASNSRSNSKSGSGETTVELSAEPNLI